MKHLVCITLIIAATALQGSQPSWWVKRGVISLDKPGDDYAVLNQGQLKHLATSAHDEMNEILADHGGAGSEVSSLIESWNTNLASSDDYSVANVGQLKAIAKVFHKRALELGLLQESINFALGVDDFSAANIGQAKALFSFEILVTATLEASSNSNSLPTLDTVSGSTVVTVPSYPASNGTLVAQAGYSVSPPPQQTSSTGLRLIGIEQSGFATIKELPLQEFPSAPSVLNSKITSATTTTEISVQFQNNNQFFVSSKGRNRSSTFSVSGSGQAKIADLCTSQNRPPFKGVSRVPCCATSLRSSSRLVQPSPCPLAPSSQKV